MQEVLREYKDVFIKELSRELPSKKMNHKIEMMLRAESSFKNTLSLELKKIVGI